jgi:hypothetical protein
MFESQVACFSKIYPHAKFQGLSLIAVSITHVPGDFVGSKCLVWHNIHTKFNKNPDIGMEIRSGWT